LTRHAVLGATAVLFVCSAHPAFAARMIPRPGAGSCREAVNGLISLLDAGNDDTPLYRDTYHVVVDTCGPVARAPLPQVPPREPPGRETSHNLAAALLDLIEDGKISSSAFVKARVDFAAVCRPW
jgi:hypothetical protein